MSDAQQIQQQTNDIVEPNLREMTRREFLLLIGGLGIGIVAADWVWQWFMAINDPTRTGASWRE